MNLRDFLYYIEENDQLVKIDEKLSPKYEIPKRLSNLDDALVFNNVKNSDIRIIGNIYGSRKRIAEALEVGKDQLIERMRDAIAGQKEPGLTTDGPVQEVEEEVDLRKIPILKHFEKDGGPYVTSSILVAQDSEKNVNLSFHRMRLLGKDRFVVRLVPRDLHRMFKRSAENDESLKVSAILGADIGTALAAATSPPYEVNEYGLAGSLNPELTLTECRTSSLLVPSEAEIVLEGELLAGERAPEGPFADITGTYDVVRDQPIFKINTVTRRPDPLYPAILPGSKEHQLLMGMPKEPSIFERISQVTEAKNVILTTGGCGWLHAVASIKKEGKEDGKKAIEAVFKAHSSVKHVVIVDEDIDIYTPMEVEWAIATRSRGDKDITIKPGIKGSSLDPTADPKTRLGCKTGIDATKDLEEPEKFERAKIP